ncbi:MAG TPA: MFS transporter, partial [Chthonomonadaceae bacterium]|nr:MFS transporter [Chthonomonadaceae bacterium]
DTMDQNIFTLVRQPAVTSLLYPHVVLSSLPKEALEAANRQITSAGGNMTAVFLLGWAVGGLLFGVVGDRLGRTRTMMLTILIYAVFTGLSGLTHTLFWFGVFRFLTALGVGGEWAAGAALVAETFPPRSRPTALGLLQALSAFGNMLAAVVTLIVPVLLTYLALKGENWRWMFAVGALPALLVLWIRRSVREPERWEHAKAEAAKSHGKGELGAIGQLFSDPVLRRNTIAAVLMAAAGVGGFWGVGNWTPELTKVVLPPNADINTAKSYVFLIQNFGAFFGAYSYALLAERTNRRRALGIFFVLAFSAIQGMFWTAHSFVSLMVWAPILGFCLLGPFSAYTVYFPELYPTRLRATGCGFCYNCARILAAGAPLTLGKLSGMVGFRMAASIVACVYVLGLIGLWIAPETKGKPLPE